MMTSSNGNIFRVTGHLCGEFTGPGEFPTQRPVTRSFDVFFDLGLNKRLSKQPWGWWYETPSWSLWRHCNAWNKQPRFETRCSSWDLIRLFTLTSQSIVQCIRVLYHCYALLHLNGNISHVNFICGDIHITRSYYYSAWELGNDITLNVTYGDLSRTVVQKSRRVEHQWCTGVVSDK